MTIYLYLDDEDETPLTSFYDMQSDPFSTGDEIYIDMDSTAPVEMKHYPDDYKKVFLENEETKRKLLHNKKIRLLRRTVAVNVRMLRENLITIEYHCELINN